MNDYATELRVACMFSSLTDHTLAFILNIANKDLLLEKKMTSFLLRCFAGSKRNVGLQRP